MPYFISKLQYKEFETGEFTDQQERDLTETLALIGNFPWLKQIGPTENQLTGPSVTIEKPVGDFLKISLNKYYNQNHGVFLLTGQNELFELFTADTTFIKRLITDFFEGDLNHSLFKLSKRKNSSKHFITAKFEYKTNFSRTLVSSIFILIYLVLFTFFSVKALFSGATFISVCFALMLIFFLFLTVRLFYKYSRNRSKTFKASRNNNVFSISDKCTSNNYNKNDIDKISVSRTNFKNPDPLVIYKIYFKNGSLLKLDNTLIPTGVFVDKFRQCRIEN